MDETNRNSAKLDIEAARLQSAADDKDKQQQEAKETYKKLSESEVEQQNPVVAAPPAADTNGGNAMVRENGNFKDGEDEKMLNGGGGDGEKEKLAQKDVEVKFISESNGDARIDMEVENQQTFSGMTKEELMKFANDPFWIRLRWFLFVLFWGLWVAMLVGAVYIIMDAPKCAAPVPLTWYEEGPLIQLGEQQNYQAQVDEIRKYGAKGVIYELPADQTYFVDTPEVEAKIKELVGTFGSKDIKVILDVTPNFVTGQDQLFKEASAQEDSPSRAAFVWKQSGKPPTNWLALDGDSAWREVGSSHVLAQFGPDRYDLQLGNAVAKDKLKGVLGHLARLGVRGFRLSNAKHFVIDADGKDDVNADVADKSLTLKDYGFWTHSHTTYQDGLGALLQELAAEVRNATNDEGFLSVSEDIVRPEAFAAGGKLGVDLPEFGNVEEVLQQAGESGAADAVREAVQRAYVEINKYSSPSGGKSWIQWPFTRLSNVGASEYSIFTFLLPGVPVVPLDVLNFGEKSHATIEQLEKFRASPTCQHGSFDIYKDANGTSVGYTREKSGNPGFLVALNLADQDVQADFSAVDGIAEELTVVLTSDHYNVTDIGVKSKVPAKAVPLSKGAALVATYVPKSKEK
ncbi:neutral and basic amino acid transport protein rBAT [Uranotaenia lowii]|uniref:neutral and basic amino acid transport protein rBAT n=1 Tax=Uranotaenia lowii TaxID=190385 RepID=UPI00247A4ED3|nr:neutral and basic amino acid transport protein rBAT [Uranotaenia lowii]